MGRKREKVLKSRFTVQRSDKSNHFKVILVMSCIAAIVVFGFCAIYSIHMLMPLLSKTSDDTSSDIEESSALSVDELNNKLLTIVNSTSGLSSDYPFNPTANEGIITDSLLTSALQEMTEAAKKDGIILKIYEGYVSPEKQAELHQAEVERVMRTGNYTQKQAEEIAEKTVPSANHAEQQTGLSVRFASKNNIGFSSTDTYIWLERNSFKYGFILRYPENKTSDTDHSADFTLFRYVGKNYALKMRTLDMCLEEYVIYLNRR